jgi:hypothetical protein
MLYVFREEDDGVAKIGYSTKPKARLRDIRGAGHLIFLEWQSAPHPRARALEMIVHAMLDFLSVQGDRMAASEWFDVTPAQAKSAINMAFAMWQEHGKNALDIARGEVTAERRGTRGPWTYWRHALADDHYILMPRFLRRRI